MFFSTWISIDTIKEHKQWMTEEMMAGLCIIPDKLMADPADFLTDIQGLPPSVALSFYISDQLFQLLEEKMAEYTDLLLTIFFQGAFFRMDEKPVIFTDTIEKGRTFIDALEQRCIAQGFAGLNVIRQSVGEEYPHGPFYLSHAQYAERKAGRLIQDCIEAFLCRRTEYPLFLVIEAGTDAVGALAVSRQIKDEFTHAPGYEIAKRFSADLEQIREYEHQLRLNATQHRNNRQYLEIQKQDLAIALDFYHYEYDILPLWFKRLGHIVKVLMGKRSLRSLFNDNVKKYKD